MFSALLGKLVNEERCWPNATSSAIGILRLSAIAYEYVLFPLPSRPNRTQSSTVPGPKTNNTDLKCEQNTGACVFSNQTLPLRDLTFDSWWKNERVRLSARVEQAILVSLTNQSRLTKDNNLFVLWRGDRKTMLKSIQMFSHPVAQWYHSIQHNHRSMVSLEFTGSECAAKLTNNKVNQTLSR